MTEHADSAPALGSADAAQRAQALDTRRSFIVQAPAGSGKTELLIQRMLALLAEVDAPEEIVAITFTRKAAGEMRVRILQALDLAAGEDAPQGTHQRTTWALARAVRRRDAQAGWGLDVTPSRLRIQTIDALCTSLARQLPVLSGFGALPRTVEQALPLYREAARRTLALLDEGEPSALAVADLLRHLDNDLQSAEALLAAMLSKRDQWLRHVAERSSPRLRRATLEAALARLTRDALENLRALMPAAQCEELVALSRFAAANLVRSGAQSPLSACEGLAGLPGSEIDDLPRWLGLAELLLTKDGKPRSKVDLRLGFPAPSSEKDKIAAANLKTHKERHQRLLDQVVPHAELIQALHRSRALPPAVYTDAQWAAVEAVTALLPLCVAQLELVCRERGQIDFTAVSQAAVRALGSEDEPTDLALALDYRIRHLLVDEFQDTSQSQYELLARLTAGWQPGDGRTLFAVGDPMQSIYRFREAEVGLYLRARREGVGNVALAPLTLSLNFRSQAGLVQWVNDAFARLLPEAEDLASGAVPFTPSQSVHAALPEAPVRVHALLARDRAAEARVVLDIVQAERCAQPAHSIAILVRSRAHLAAIVPALKAAGLRFQAIEIEALGHRPVVQDLRVLTRALLHPADRIAWLAVLRAPWCGLTVPDLDALARSDHRVCLWELMDRPAQLASLSTDGRARLTRLRETLRHCFAQRRREPLRRWIEGAWLALGGPAAAADEADLEDAQMFLALLDTLDRGGDLPDFAELDEHMERLFARPDAGADTRLQVMTIYKAKGLEFDSVILPGLGYKPRADAPRLLHWLERPRAHAGADLLLAPIRSRDSDADPVYRYLELTNAAKAEHEDGRLLYVAATRARARLHLVGHATLKDGIAQATPRSLLHRLWPAVHAEFEAAARPAQTEPAQTEPAQTDPAQADSTQQQGEPAQGSALSAPPTVLRRLLSDWRPPQPIPAVALAGGRAPFGTQGMLDPVEFSWASESARHAGSVVHRALQRIAEDGLARWDTHRVGACAPLFTRDLRALGVPDSMLEAMLARVTHALCLTLDDAHARWVLGAHTEAACELRLSGVLDGAVIDVVLDRTFVDEQGTRWIVDYKTGTHTGGSVESFLDTEQERYRVQLERYARVTRSLDGRPVRLALYFPLLRAWREWTQ